MNNSLLNIGLTYVLATFAWIFFRANELQDSFYIITHIIEPASSNWGGATFTGLSTVKTFYSFSQWLALIGALAVLFVVEKAQSRLSINQWLVQRAQPIRWAIYYGIVVYIAVLGAFEHVQFIYFQF